MQNDAYISVPPATKTFAWVNRDILMIYAKSLIAWFPWCNTTFLSMSIYVVSNFESTEQPPMMILPKHIISNAMIFFWDIQLIICTTIVERWRADN